MSKEPQSGVLVKESESVYTLWCTGRQFCEAMLVELKVFFRFRNILNQQFGAVLVVLKK